MSDDFEDGGENVKKTVINSMGIFVAIANNTLYGSKLSISLAKNN